MAEKPLARIYVVGKLRHLEALPAGSQSWWCVEADAQPGEIAALYVKGAGVSKLLRVVEVLKTSEALCRDYRLATARIAVLRAGNVPISAQTMREHATLRRLPALARSFQRRSFRLDEPFLGALLKLMKAK